MHIYNLFTFAALDIPNWMPKWVKEHPAIQKATNVFKNMGVNDFKIELTKEQIASLNISHELDESTNAFMIEYKNNYKSMISSTYENIKKTNLLLSNTVVDDLLPFIKDLKLNDFYENKCPESFHTKYKKNDKTFILQIDAGEKLTKAYEKIRVFCEKFADISIPSITEFKTINAFSNRKVNEEKLYIVFSKKYEDILAMSSRSKWKNCQEIHEGSFKECIIPSALSSTVGIIYLTSGKDFKERGEIMLTRSIVRLIVDIDDNKNYLFIDNPYGSSPEQCLDLFQEILDEKSDYPVLTPKTKNKKYYTPTEEIFKELNITDESYQDTHFSQIPPKNHEIYIKIINYILEFKKKFDRFMDKTDNVLNLKGIFTEEDLYKLIVAYGKVNIIGYEKINETVLSYELGNKLPPFYNFKDLIKLPAFKTAFNRAKSEDLDLSEIQKISLTNRF